MRLLGSLGILVSLLAAGPAYGQTGCSSVADSLVEAGWLSYRVREFGAAGESFRAAYQSCADHVGARVGLGYTALSRGDSDEARSWFDEVLQEHPDIIDALTGLGILAWREGDLPEVRRTFSRVLELEPGHQEARAYLQRLPAGIRPVERPPLVLPDTMEVRFRTYGDRFEILEGDQWKPFYVKGVNLGAALPGKFPSQFPDSAVYVDWIGRMADLGANVVRVYTIHPPWFYQALLDHNESNPENPIYLIHGVWASRPPEDDFSDPVFEAGFLDEASRVVDLLHGRADLPPRRGHASGSYTADLSPWTLAYLIGREWEPSAVARHNRKHPHQKSWEGKYLSVRKATAMDVWVTRMCDFMVAYEASRYRAQRPIAYTNWPTLDPLHHPTESTVEEEIAVRRSLGDDPYAPDVEHDSEDAETLDPSLVEPMPRFQAGFYASYHAYPYYPDFMVLGSPYPEYLRRLKAHHSDLPVLIAEYGVPTSLGIAHLQPFGWHHGGHTEADAARINATLTRLIAETGMAGGVFFAWIDEWFKRNWLVADLELPPDRNRLWLNRLDPEQQYGLLATDPEPAVSGGSLAERLRSWKEGPSWYGGLLSAGADAGHLWLMLDSGLAHYRRILIGLDVREPESGAFHWPRQTGSPPPLGLETVIEIAREEVRLLVASRSNPNGIVREDIFQDSLEVPDVADEPPGTFYGPYRQYRAKIAAVSRSETYDSLRVITNARRWARDGTEYAAIGYDRGVLREGPLPDGQWEIHRGTGSVELRIPWLLINVTDPSGRWVLGPPGETGNSSYAPVEVEDIGLVVTAQDREGRWEQWPADPQDVARFSWPTWEQPEWRVRTKPTFRALQLLFRQLDEIAEVVE